MSYQIVTDATADMDYSLLDAHVIPMKVYMNQKEFLYGPDGNISVKTFYEALREGTIATTSQITPFEFNYVFEKYMAGGKDVLYLAFSSGMSGTYQNALLSAIELMKEYPQRRIICVDTLSASVKEGYLVYEAVKRKKEGMKIDDLANWVMGKRVKIHNRFIVDDLETLKRGGRISKVTALTGMALQIKPILEINEEGNLKLIRKYRGRKNSIRALFYYYQEKKGKHQGDTVRVGHGDCIDDAIMLSGYIHEKFPNTSIIITPVGPVIGAHTGPGMLSIAFNCGLGYV
ncbi:DegV family protein [Sedimentibacter sp.]|uniref:DegV family protein n=1 Tax=Sedimentibacter sp. TaxID=1960295 RepID=UPI0028A17ECF|nr:DegV family protein [Sedimentibacter sp.]